MNDLTGVWLPCTPRWVEAFDGCGDAVRAPVLEECPERPGHFHAIGHAHMMVTGPDGRQVPLQDITEAVSRAAAEHGAPVVTREEFTK